MTVKLWADPETDGAKACCSPEAVLGARALAHSLGIPHFTLDLEEDFRRRVVGEFVDGYAAGRTPNPCVLCNGEVRIAAMVDLADRLGATHLVTGHYARIVDDGDGPLLAAASDEAKDQSYMLAALPPRLLGPAALPAHRPDQARGAGDRRPPRPRRRPQGREPGPLLPRRPGQARVPAPPRRPAGSRRRAARPLRPRPRPPPRPPPLHGRPAPRHRRRRPRAALRPRHRRRLEHRHGRHPRRAGDDPGAHPRRDPTPRRRQRRRGPAALPLARPSRTVAPPARAGTTPSTSSCSSPSRAPRRARRPRCWPATRSSATARSPLATDAAPTRPR